MSQPITGHGCQLGFPVGPKDTNSVEELASCFLSSFVNFYSAVSQKRRKSRKMYLRVKGQGGHLGFSIDPKNINFVEDVSILLPVQFQWIPFSGFSVEAE